MCIPAAPQYRHDDGPVYTGAGSQYYATGTAPSHIPPSIQLSSPLPPQEQLAISVIFTPTKGTVYCSALDISDVAHSRKYRVGATDVLVWAVSSITVTPSARRYPSLAMVGRARWRW